jgi:N,N'-diacetyllegionaminate synthase
MAGYKSLNIDGKSIGQTNRPYIIAEMACAHNGRKEEALKLIDLAVNGGADAIQLQIFTIEEMIVPTHEVYNLVKDIELSKSDWKEIFNHARTYNIDIIIFAYDIASLDFAIELSADAIKFNSSDLLNIEMLERVAKEKIPFLLHTGSSSVDEVNSAINYARQFDPGQMILMHGVQNFPTEVANANIARVKLLKDIFKLPSGYDDHTEGGSEYSKMIDLIAIGIGADVLEKHITLSRAEKGIDYVSALEEDEFADYVKRVHLSAKALGQDTPREFNESDFKYRKFQKKSIVAIRDLNVGEILLKEDFKFLRNETNGLQPIASIDLIGKEVIRKIEKHQNILRGDMG